MVKHELETLEALDLVLASGEALSGTVLQDLDLRGHSERLLQRDLSGVTLLGCDLTPELHRHVVACGALDFPNLPDAPFELHRASLYTPEELFDAFDPARPESYQDCFDAKVYRYFMATDGERAPSILETLARSLHDHAMSNGVAQLLRDDGTGAPRKVVAIMGGHSMLRSDPRYFEVAAIARILTRRGFFMASGGGPGAMEATHLGAYFVERSLEELRAACETLSVAPKYDHPRWLSAAFQVLAEFPLADDVAERYPSLGIPTWLYGHEPPNVFATHVAKYFANSIREDGLLTVATHGVVFSPGSAGTIQEIFQDACQNHYRKGGRVSPMVFIGERYWSETKPVFPLVAALAHGHEYAHWLALTDEPDDVVALLERYRDTV